MSSIDSRVVEMKFDNAAFERGIQTTLKSLGDLQKGLKLDGATKGLDNLSASASKLSLGSIANGVGTIASRFSAMGIVGVTALATIAQRAVTTGAVLAKSLTLDPIMAGFSEYELKLGSIQTILANTAKDNTTLAQVSAALNDLNHYADKTIYDFGQMTKNIGLFTNAGLGLKESTSMIKGFSNEAAASGTNAEGAAGAAYQLSQALSAGKITLMDWRSLQNVGMGNANMKNGILDIATAMGTLEKHGTTSKKVQTDFNGSLEKGWLTADVMSKYLRIMAGDMSVAEMKSMGLSKAQIASFQKQQKTAEDAATKVRTFTQLLGTMKEAVGSGWASTFELLFGNFDQATVLFTNVNNVLGGFIQHSADARNKVIGDWKALGGRTVLIKAISDAFNILISVLKPIKDAFREIFPAATGKQLFAITKTFGDFMAHLKMGADTAANLKRTFAGFFALFSIGISLLKGIGTAIKTAFQSSGGSGGILEFTGNIGDWLVKLDKAIKAGKGFHDFFVGLGKVLRVPIDSLRFLVGILNEVLGGVNDVAAAGEGKLSKSFDKLGAKFSDVGGILKTIWGFLTSLTEKFSEFFSGMGDEITAGADSMNFDAILSAINTSLLGGLVLLFKRFLANGLKIDFGGGFLGGMKDALKGLTGVLGAMQTNLKANALLKIAAAIGLLALSVGLMSRIDPKRLTSAMSGLAVMFGQMIGAMALLDKALSTKGFIKMPFMTVALIALGVAIDLLAIAVSKMAALDWNGLAKGLTGVAVLLISLALFTKFSTANKGAVSSAASLILLGLAIKLLVDSVQDISGMKWGEIAKGLTGVAALLVSLALFTKFSAANAGGIAQGAGLILVALAIKILASAIKDIGQLSWTDIAKGLGAMAVGLGLIGVALSLIPASSILSALAIVMVALSFTRIAAALVIVVGALDKLADVVKKMSGMSWEEIAKGLITMGVAIALIAAALILIPKTAIFSAAAVLVMAISIGMIADALGKMGNMSWEQIAKGLVTLAASLLIIIGAMYLMPGALPGAIALLVIADALKIFASVMTTFGSMGWSAIIASLVMLAGIFVILGLAGLVLAPVVPVLDALGTAVLLLGLGMLAAGAGMLMFSAGLAALAVTGAAGAGAFVSIVKAFADTLPYVMTQFGVGLIAFAKVMATAGPAFADATVTVLIAIMNAIDKTAPKVVTTLADLLLLLLKTIVKYQPQMTDAGYKLLKGILKGIGDNIDEIVTIGTDIIVNFLNALSKNLPRIQQAGADLIIKFVNGTAEAIRNNSKAMGEAGGNLASAMIEGMVTGLGAGVGKVIDEATKVAKSAYEAAKKKLGINSPSKEFHKLGMGSDEGMANGLVDYTHLVTNAAEGVGQSAIEAMRKSISSIADVVTTDVDFNPIIRPVLDLTDVQKNAAQIGSMLSTTPIAVTAAYTTAKDASAGYNDNQVAQTQPEQATATTDVSFTQINNSPKALSSAEIYRQTKNQLSVAKGALTK